jgi:hypothetical protein
MFAAPVQLAILKRGSPRCRRLAKTLRTVSRVAWCVPHRDEASPVWQPSSSHLTLVFLLTRCFFGRGSYSTRNAEPISLS